MKIPTAPPSLRTRNASSSSSVQVNSDLTRSNREVAFPFGPVILFSSAKIRLSGTPRLIYPLEPHSVTLTADFIKSLRHRIKRKIDLVRLDRQRRSKPDNVIRIQAPIHDHPTRDNGAYKAPRDRRVVKLYTD